jgi:hypothetical protein
VTAASVASVLAFTRHGRAIREEGLLEVDAELVMGYIRDQVRRGLQPTTVCQSQRTVCNLSRWLSPRGLLDATPLDIEGFLDYLPGRAQSRIPATRAWYLSIIHAFY